MVWSYFLLAMCAGAGLAVQAGMNAKMRQVSGEPAFAVLVNFAVGLVPILAFFFISRAVWPSREQLLAGPVWMWLGGFLGAAYVVSAIVAAPKLGSGSLVAATVAGQLAASVVIDHFGWVGFVEHPLTPGRVVGVVLLVAGVFLIQRF
jgi:transporter family-2 protein